MAFWPYECNRSKVLLRESVLVFLAEKMALFSHLMFENIWVISFEQLGTGLFLARLFSKKTSRYCHSPGGGVMRKL